MWTKERLQRFVKHKLGAAKLVVAANRETYVHQYSGDEIVVVRPPGGLVTAIDPVLQACGGVLVALGLSLIHI